MRLPGEQEDRGTGLPLIYMIIGAAALVLIILVVVMMNNGNSGTNKRNAGNTDRNINTVAATEEPTESGLVSGEEGYIDKLYKDNKLRVDDLDFWDMYPENEDTAMPDKEVKPEAPVETPKPAPAEEDPSLDGKHTLISREDGSEEWVTINSYIPKNTYDMTKLILKNDRMGYYEGEKLVSYFGVDISKYNGTVDFEALKKAGVDFVMIRLGARGYGSGQIVLDENFQNNIKGANEAGIDVGIYFFSQAVTPAEASEEAAVVVQNLAEYRVTYPVVFDMEYINNDTARIDGLTKNNKTEIANTFLTDIRTAGYTPMLYGTKEWLLEQIDLTKLLGYDVWLSQQLPLPDYPYKYQMWQYSLSGSIAGIQGNVDFNVSFVDYAAKY